jgi:hypothetical protein
LELAAAILENELLNHGNSMDASRSSVPMPASTGAVVVVAGCVVVKKKLEEA